MEERKNASGGLVLSLPIVKIDRELGEVWGVATTEALDQQGEIVDYEASKKAFSEWTNLFNQQTGGASLGNIREMHQPKVVGRLIAYQPDDSTRKILVGARINRDTADGRDAWNKVLNHELNGFSIGAPTAERIMQLTPQGKVTRVVGYKLAELSLVDNPACPEAFFNVVKRAGPNLVVDRHLIVPMEESPVVKADQWSPKTDDQREWLSNKIKLLIDEGKPRDQAVAIAHSMGGEKFEGKSAAVTAGIKEEEMDAKVLAKQAEEVQAAALEKGKKIGPQHHAVADPPGAQKPKLEHLEAPEEPPTPAKSAEAGGGVPGDDKGKDVTVPEGQGKAADADADAAAKYAPMVPGQQPPMMGQPQMRPPIPPGGQMTPPHMDVPLPPARKEPPMNAQPPYMAAHNPMYCSYCGTKFASASGSYFHPECQKAAEQAALQKAAMTEIVAKGDLSGLSKLFRQQADALDGMSKAYQHLVVENDELKKRVKVLEDQPTAGGPARTELPSGVRPVEKAAAPASAALTKEAALEKAMEEIHDPFVRDRLSRELAKSQIRRAQEGR